MTAPKTKSRSIDRHERRILELGIAAYIREVHDPLTGEDPDTPVVKLTAGAEEALEEARKAAATLAEELAGATRVVIESNATRPDDVPF